MTKRIVSGVFLLIAFGALGLILAGALTSGEQLIVRFLTAVIVAALGLYVISDLRLQSAGGTMAADDATLATAAALRRRRGADALPPDSTAAFMATVTGKNGKNGKRSTSTAAALEADKQLREADLGADEDASDELDLADDPAVISEPGPATEMGTTTGTDPESDSDTEADAADVELSNVELSNVELSNVELSQVEVSDAEVAEEPAEEESGEEESADTPASADESHDDDSEDTESVEMAASTANDEPRLQSVPAIDQDEPYAQDAVELEHWPVRPDGEPVEEAKPAAAAAAALADDELDGLVAIFAKEQDRAEAPEPALAVNGDLPSFFASRPEPPRAPLSSVGTAAPMSPTSTSATSDAISYTHAPIAPIIDLRLKQAKTSSDAVTSVSEIEAAIRSGEVDVISSLIEEGVLSTEGPLSDRDVRTMVYVAFTSSELRKILVAGGTIDGDNSDLDLGPIEVFHPAAALDE